jgi:hypothetical protein
MSGSAIVRNEKPLNFKLVGYVFGYWYYLIFFSFNIIKSQPDIKAQLESQSSWETK